MGEWTRAKGRPPEDGVDVLCWYEYSAMAAIIVCFRHTASDTIITKCGAEKWRTEFVRE